jgi:hypothetical protein
VNKTITIKTVSALLALTLMGSLSASDAYAKGKSLVIGGVHSVPAAKSFGNFSLAPHGYRSSWKVEQNLGRTRSYYQPSYGFK